jgi:hypothetical protein
MFPIEFLKSFLVLFFDRKNNCLKTNFYCILPNITLDYYQIKPNNYSLSAFKGLFRGDLIDEMNLKVPCKTNYVSGFLKLNSQSLVAPFEQHEFEDYSNMVGVWISDLPKDDSKINSNPLIWST